MKRESIFKLYIGSVKVRAKANPDRLLTGIRSGVCYVELSNKTEVAMLLPNCQLLLKPISGMSEEHLLELGELYIKEYNSEPSINYGQKEKDGTLILSNIFTPETVLWLIEHGYCLDDNWFTSQDGLSIAIRAEEK